MNIDIQSNRDFVFFKSPLGVLKIEANAEGLCGISCGTFMRLKNQKVQNQWILQTVHELDEYFNGRRKSFGVSLSLKGTPFQMKVWQELTQIPYGQTISYKDQAKTMASEKSTRAIASAIGKNPVPIIIPCHRVIGSDGSLTGFIWGLDKKEVLLKGEGLFTYEQKVIINQMQF